MEEKSKQQFKKFRRIRLFATILKIILVIILQLVFQTLTFFISGHGLNQSVGLLLSNFIGPLFFYTFIFIVNRKFNFKDRESLQFDSVVFYIGVVSVLLLLETLYIGPLQNTLYLLSNLGLIDGANNISLSTVNNPIVYLLIGAAVSLASSFISSLFLFLIYKHFLTD